MQMEFERRIQLISPDLMVENKPSSDLIFSYLNAAQDRYVVMNYVGDDQTVIDTKTFNKNVDAIKSLLIEKELVSTGVTPMGFVRFRLPYTTTDEYFLYVQSMSKVTGTYKKLSGTVLLTNQLVKYTDLPKYAQTALNTPIVRQPATAFMSDPNSKYNYLIVAADKYTTVQSLILTYYRRPLRFNTIGSATKCELPDTVHSEIVDLAVDMFITEGKYRLNVKPQPENKE